MNPRITSLTGSPLFDEKAINTLHIAIGDNAGFGGDVSALAHYDLVTCRPSLLLDDRLVMNRGDIDRDLISSLRNAASSVMQEFPVRDAVIYLREGRIGFRNGQFMRRLSKAQRVNYVRFASEEIAVALGELCEALRAYDRVHITAFLKNHCSFNSFPTSILLNTLQHYRVLGVLSAARDKSQVRSAS